MFGEEIEGFEIRVHDDILEDLHRRLVATRLPDQIEGTGWEYGTPVDYVRDPDGQLLELLPVTFRAKLPPKP